MKIAAGTLCTTLFIMYTVLFYSCSPNFYVPNQQHVPGFTSQGQTKLSASLVLNPDNDVKGGDVQLAHSITDRTAILFNVNKYYGYNKSSQFHGFPFGSNNYDLGGSGHALEVGYGYFKANDSRVITEVYGFASLASFCNNTHLGDLNGNFKGKFTRLAIQPSITYKTKYFEAALSSRINHLHYYKIRGQYELYDELLENTPDNFFFEPAITLRIGFNRVKLQLQYQYSYWLNSNKLNENNNEVKYPFTKMNFTLGLKFDL